VNRVRVGVIGVGYMGRLHAEKLAALVAEDEKAVEFVGVADVRAERARGVAHRLETSAWVDHRPILERADAVVVAVPTVSHFPIVRDALEAGVDVLVEKPIASTLDEAERLLELARAGERILQVGHLEWFNGVMSVIRDHIRAPQFIEVHRLGPFPDRATDIDVVRDVMIHDLDILQQIVGEAPAEIDAVGVSILSGEVDIANARLRFPSGCVANLTASRVTSTPTRKMRFFQPDGYFSVDFLEQSAVAIRRESGTGGDGAAMKLEKLEVARGDALAAQLRDFLFSVRTRNRPAVDGVDGLDALRTAVRVNAAMSPVDADSIG
jgi:predicted dehydrogenase